MIVHLNDRLVPLEEASINPFDRGFIFGDGVYEGLRSFDGAVVAMRPHIDRMRNGLREARIDWDPDLLIDWTDALLDANGLRDAFIYWQVTRGSPGPGDPVRDRIPPESMRPTVFGYCSPMVGLDAYEKGPPTCRAVTAPDLRWHRGHLKSISLHGSVLAAIEAGAHDAQDAIQMRDGLVTEACASNVILALPDGKGGSRLVTPSLESVSILAGVTRLLLLDADSAIEQRAVRAEELLEASEIMLCGTTVMVTSVVELDGRPVGDGRPGPAAQRLLASFLRLLRETHMVGAGSEAR